MSWKKWFSAFFAVVMVISLLPAADLAEENEADSALELATQAVEPKEEDTPDDEAELQTAANQEDATGQESTTGMGQTETSVAKVGDQYFNTLAEAIKAIGDEGTVELVADVVLDEGITIKKTQNITLDLGTHTVTLNSSFSPSNTCFTNTGTLTIVGNGTIGSGENQFVHYPIFNNGGTLHVTSGSLIGTLNGIRNQSNGTVDISGGRISNSATSGELAGAIYGYGGSITIRGNAEIDGVTAAVRAYGCQLTVADNASLSGQFGVMLFNQKSTPAKLTMTGGTIDASYGFALSGNNTTSAGCSADITGGTLRSIPDGTGIYWPMEGELTVGGNARVEGGTGIEAKMGTITIQDQAQIVGTGAYLDDAPVQGGAQAEGSALLVSAQMYGGNDGQYVNSPDLTVHILGGTLTGTQGNGVTVYNTEGTNAQTVNVEVTGGQLVSAAGKTDLKVVVPNGGNVSELTQTNEGNIFTTSKSKTRVSVSSDVACAAVDQAGKISYYMDAADALEAANASAEEAHVYVLGNSSVSGEALKSEQIKLTTAQGVSLQITSDVADRIVQETTNANGTKTYELVEASRLPAPEVTLTSAQTSVHAGKTITLTASIVDKASDVAYSYTWYKDGAVLEAQTGDTLAVTESGTYAVSVTAQKTTEANVTLTSATTRSGDVVCTVEPHEFQWVVDKRPTATEAGSRHQECGICGYQSGLVEEIPATGETAAPGGTTEPGATTTPGDTTQPAGTGNQAGAAANTTAPKTGDSSMAVAAVAALAVACVGLAAVLGYNRRRKTAYTGKRDADR